MGEGLGAGWGVVLVGVGLGPVPVGVGAGLVGVGVGGGGVAQVGVVKVSSSRVTAPLRASARPVTVSPVVTADEAWDVGRRAAPGGVVVGGGQVGLGVSGDAVGAMDRAVGHEAGREPGHRAARAHAEVPADPARAGVGAVVPARTAKLLAVPSPTGAIAATAADVAVNRDHPLAMENDHV
jgi:hypothetical protein